MANTKQTAKPDLWAKLEFPKNHFGAVDLGRHIPHRFLDITRKKQTSNREGEVHYYYIAKVYDHEDRRGLMNYLNNVVGRGDLKITWYKGI